MMYIIAVEKIKFGKIEVRTELKLMGGGEGLVVWLGKSEQYLGHLKRIRKASVSLIH